MHPDRTADAGGSLPGVLAGLGALSGVLSFVVFVFFGVHAMGAGSMGPAMVIPGLIFGLLVGGAICHRQSAGTPVYLGFVAASTGSYFVASSVGFELAAGVDIRWVEEPFGISVREFWHVGAVSGLLGAAILTSYAFIFLPYRSRLGESVLVVVIGTFLGAVLFPAVPSIPVFGLAILFVGWQSLLAASLGVAVRWKGDPPAKRQPLADPPPSP